MLNKSHNSSRVSGERPGAGCHHEVPGDEVRQERLHRQPRPLRPLPLRGHHAPHPGQYVHLGLRYEYS